MSKKEYLLSFITLLRDFGKALFQYLREQRPLWQKKIQSIRLTLPLICFLIFFYFLYHFISGERGLVAYFYNQSHFTEVKKMLHETNEQVDQMEAQVARLRPQTLDLDTLEEEAKKNLSISYPDELLVFDNPQTP